MRTMKHKLKDHPFHQFCDFGIKDFNKTKRDPDFIEAANSSSKARGRADKTAPSVPSGLSVVATTSSLKLSWNPSTDNVGVIGYKVTINGGLPQAVSTTSYTFLGLTGGTSYTLTVSAFDAAANYSAAASIQGRTLDQTYLCPDGVSTYTTDINVCPQCPDGTFKTPSGCPPPVVNPPTASISVSPTSIQTGNSSTLSWSTSGADNVFIDNGIGNVAASGSTSVNPTVTTTYNIVATNAGGTTQASTTLTVTYPTDSSAPSVPSNLAYVATTSTITVSWNPSTDNVAVQGYEVTIDSSTYGTNTTSITLSGLTANTTYGITVNAYDAAGNHSTNASISATTASAPASGGGVILLDFDGQYVTNTAWNTNGPINAAYSGLTNDEIAYVYANISADYAPYNVTVTTDEAVYNAADPLKRTRVIFTETSDWYGSAGGVAMIGSMFWGDNTPCWVFTALLSYNVRYIWTAGSHEAGHTVGLRHQSVYDPISCVKTSEYNYGTGTTAPIMGAAYTRTPLWWIGPNSIICNCPTCGVIQDDNAFLTQKLGLK